MDRSDFESRRERKIDYFANMGIIMQYAQSHYDVTSAELFTLLYLDPLKHFTQHDFKKGTVYLSWNNMRWTNLLNKGMIEKVPGKVPYGNKWKYKTTNRCRRMINFMYRLSLGVEEIPGRAIKNKKHARYMDKVRKTAFNDFNDSIYKRHEKNDEHHREDGDY